MVPATGETHQCITNEYSFFDPQTSERLPVSRRSAEEPGRIPAAGGTAVAAGGTAATASTAGSAAMGVNPYVMIAALAFSYFNNKRRN